MVIKVRLQKSYKLQQTNLIY